MSVFDFQRLDSILNLLIERQEPVPIHELTAYCRVSDRTIRSDVNTINDYIANNGASITLVRKKGYVLTYSDKEKFNQFWSHQDTGTFLFTSSESRMAYLIRKFLTSDDYISQDYLQSILFISQNTLYSDLRTFKQYLQEYHLSLVNKSNLGYLVKGLEENKRSAIINLIFKENITEYIAGTSKSVRDICININYEQFLTIFNKHFQEIIHLDSDYFYRNLLTSFLLAVSRIKSGYTLVNFDKKLVLTEQIETIITAFIVEMEVSFNLQISSVEKYYFEFLMAENFPNYIDEQSDTNQKLALQLVDMIYATLTAQTDATWVYDERLRSHLTDHIKLFLTVKKIKGNRSNPILRTIKNNFPYAFDLAVACSKTIIKNYGICFSEDELSYIALHFANAMEKNKARVDEQLSLAIVCGSGKTFSSIIESKIKRRFPNVFSTISKFSFSNFNHNQDYHHFDVVLSTIPMDMTKYNLIQININDLEGAMDTISVKLHSLLQERSETIQLFFEDCFISLRHRSTKEDVFSMVHHILEEKGFVKDKFLQDLYEREAISSTVIGDYVALPHPLGDSVIKDCIFPIVAPKGIKWDEQVVKFVFVLAIQSNASQDAQIFYDYLLDFIASEKSQQQLLKTPSFETLRQIFKL